MIMICFKGKRFCCDKIKKKENWGVGEGGKEGSKEGRKKESSYLSVRRRIK